MTPDQRKRAEALMRLANALDKPSKQRKAKRLPKKILRQLGVFMGEALGESVKDLRPETYLSELLALFRRRVDDSTCMVVDIGRLWLNCRSEGVSICLRFAIPSADGKNHTWPVEEVLSFQGLEILDDDDNEVFDVALRYLSTDWIDFAFEAAEKSKAFMLAAEATWLRKIEEYEAACSRMSG